jgi:transposase
VAVAESGRNGEVRQVGVFENRAEILCKMAARLGKGRRRLSFCYEAGPCGYGLHRLLTGCGHSCIVVAPSLIPIKSGDRVKTDRRDAMMLAKLHRAGELTAICIPDAAHEAIRDLVRAQRRQGGCCPKRASTCKAFCCAMTGSTAGLAPGRWLTGVG